MSDLVNKLFNFTNTTDTYNIKHDTERRKVYYGLINYFNKHTDKSYTLKGKSIVEKDDGVVFEITNDGFDDLSFCAVMNLVFQITDCETASEFIKSQKLNKVENMIYLIKHSIVSCDEYKQQYLDTLTHISVLEYEFNLCIDISSIELKYSYESMSVTVEIKNTYTCSTTMHDTDYKIQYNNITHLRQYNTISDEIIDTLRHSTCAILSDDYLFSIRHSLKSYLNDSCMIVDVKLKINACINSRLSVNDKFKYALIVVIGKTSTLKLSISTRNSIKYDYRITYC